MFFGAWNVFFGLECSWPWNGQKKHSKNIPGPGMFLECFLECSWNVFGMFLFLAGNFLPKGCLSKQTLRHVIA